MNSWRIILATVVIFAAGVVTGGLLVNHVQPHVRRPPPQPPALSMPDILNQKFIQQLNEQLNLTPAQRKRIHQVISEGQQRNRELWKLVAPQVHLVMQDTRQRIRETLTPDQRTLFEDMLKQYRALRRPQLTNAPPVPESEATNAPMNSPGV